VNIGRNDPCHCGSGKKYKKCCLSKVNQRSLASLMQHKIRRAEGALLLQMQDWLRQDDLLHLLEEAVTDFVDLMPFEPDESQLKSLWETMLWYYILLDWESTFDSEGLPSVTIAEMFVDEFSVPVFEQKLLGEMLNAPFTFVQVEDVIEDQGLYLKDLLLGRQIFVEEKSASLPSLKGDIFLTKIITMQGTSVMMGAFPHVLPGHFAGDILNLRDEISESMPLSIEGLIGVKPLIINAYWLCFYEASRPSIIKNQDGDNIEPNELIYQTALSMEKLMEILLPLSPYENMDEFLQEGATFDEKGNAVEVQFPKLDSQNILLAEFSLQPGQIRVSTNSAKRSGRIKSSLTRRLGKHVQLVEQTWHPLEGLNPLMEQGEASFEGAQISCEQIPAEFQAILAEKAQEHWQDWLTHPLPALNGKTPRQVSKTVKGRERLEALLLDFEGSNLVFSDNVMRPDTDWLREQLGLD
jgi:hypothetical protein